jgi:tetratricopeptide (TPR) repeat protein
LWELAAAAAFTSGDWATASGHAGRARDYYTDRGQARAAARAQATAGQALRLWGHHADAREQLTAAVEVLRPDPDADTVRALGNLAQLEVFAGSPAADALTTEALILGQAVGVDNRQLGDLFMFRGIYLTTAGRLTEAVSYCHQAVRLATQAGDNFRMGRALLNLADVLAATDPAAAADAARTAARHSRQAGARDVLAYAIVNLAQALLMTGNWDAAEAELTQAADADGLTGHDLLACQRGWLAALRGDTQTAETMLAALPLLRASEGPQDQAMVSLAKAFTAAARRRPKDALRHTRATLAHAGVLGISAGQPRWAWPLAARTADELGDATILRELITLLDNCPPGHLPPMLRAERDLARARLDARNGDMAASASFIAAISSLHELSAPYHLAHGLLDHAEYLTRLGDAGAAGKAIDEAREIAGRLGCHPLLDRAAGLTREGPGTTRRTAALK